MLADSNSGLKAIAIHGQNHSPLIDTISFLKYACLNPIGRSGILKTTLCVSPPISATFLYLKIIILTFITSIIFKELSEVILIDLYSF